MINVQKIIQETNNFQIPMLFENAFDEEDINEIDVVNLLNRTTEVGYETVSRRVYIGNDISNEFALKVHQNKILSGETLTEWSKRIFGENKFGILINFAEQYDYTLTSKCSKILKKIIDIFGLPVGGFGMTIFMGNYSASPLGIHVDKYLTNVLHFHIRPNSKEMVLWEKDKFIELTGSEDNCYSPLQFKEFGRSFNLSKNSIFNLPASDYYHIGFNEGLSIAVTIGLFKVNVQMLVDNAISEYLRDFYQVSKRNLELIQFDEIPVEDFFEMKKLNNITLSDFIKNSINNRKSKLLTNGGFKKELLLVNQ